MGRVVGDYWGLSACVIFLNFANFIFREVDRAENEIHIVSNTLHIIDIAENHAFDVFGDRLIEKPSSLHSLSVSFAFAVWRSCDYLDIEPLMIVENLDKSLSDHSSSTENADT